MNAIKPDQLDTEKDIICHCSGTTKKQITALIENGHDNLESISRMSGASSGCGSCEDAVLELLAEKTL